MAGEKHYPTDPLSEMELDDGARVIPAKPCASRLIDVGQVAWCVLVDGHDGVCAGHWAATPPPSAFDKGKGKPK